MRSKRKSVGYVVLYHPFEVGAENAGAIQDAGRKFLENPAFDLVCAPQPVHDSRSMKNVGLLFKNHGVNAIIINLATWCDDNLLLDLVAIHDVPVINWALKDVNSGSLCGAQQFNMVLKELGKASHVVIGKTGQSRAEIESIIGDLPPLKHETLGVMIPDEGLRSLVEGLKHLRVGIVGARCQGMMEVAFDEFSIKKVIGPSILSLSLDEIKERIDEIPDEKADLEVQRFISKHPRLKISAAHKDLTTAFKNYLVLKSIVEEREIGAMTVECYPRYMGKTCIAFSLLADEGIACACEGDVHAAILMWILQRLTGLPVNHIDFLDYDEKENTVLGGHCGSCSMQLVESEDLVEIAPVRLANTGACVLFPTKPGKVILMNLVGREGSYRCFLLEGDAIPATKPDGSLEFPGNPAKIRLGKPVEKFLEIVADKGFGHHWVVAFQNKGNTVPRLLKLFEFMKIPVSR
ncbi:MAG: hypothetical protein ACTSWN_03015 [Promethearchaeota archaeon]